MLARQDDAVPVSEVRAVAELCRSLIGSHQLQDKDRKDDPLFKPGDIGLLAPVGTQLWRNERALEQLVIPVASQAGKGFFRRQEIQDLIAVTRTLPDSRDTLAFGALMRGPLVGLSEEALLDIINGPPALEDPNGQTMEIARHADTGASRNAQIRVLPMPGKKFARVRHFSTMGTGPYNILVRRDGCLFCRRQLPVCPHSPA